MADATRADVFVSYRHREPTMSWVRDELYPRLTERFSVILDERDFVDAAVLIDEIETSAARARVTLAIVDDTYLDSGFTALECATCTELMVVVRGDVDRLPTAARYVDMRDDRSCDTLLDELDDMIRRVFVLEAEADGQWVEGFLLPALRSVNVDATHVLDLSGPGYRADALDVAIERADRVIVVVSSAYLRGTHDGAGRHLRHYEAKEHVDKTVPVVIEHVEMPRVYDQRLWIDASERTLWDDALRRICELLELPAPRPTGPPPCPYPGMKPYGEDGSHPFVGRDAEIAEVLDRLRKRRIATVIGPSGSGKSSLVLAGVLPRIRANGIDGESDMAIEVIRPTDDPSGALGRLDAVADTRGGRVGRLLVVDQFEEVFSGSAEHGPALLDTLVERRASDPGLHVILTVRADFYSELMGHPLWTELAPTRVEVPPLAGEALREAIREPAAHSGVVIDGALVERLAAETEGQPGLMPFLQEAIRSAWANIQWRYLTLDSYEGDGADGEFGVRQAIRRQADAALEVIKARDPDDGERIARSLLLRLVQFGEGGPHTRRQVPVSQLVGEPPDPAFEAVFEILAHPEQRIITVGARERPDRDEPEDVADLSHEAIIAGWPTFTRWIDTHERVERERRRWVERSHGELLTGGDLAAAELWLVDARESNAYPDSSVVEFIEASRAATDERERAAEHAAARRRRLLIGGLVGALVVAVVMSALAVFGWWSWRSSQESQRAAEREVDRRVANQLPTSASAYTGGLALQALLVRAADIIEETDLGAIEMLATVERDPPIARRIDATTDGVGFEAAALVGDGTIVIGDGVGDVAVFRADGVGPAATTDVGHGVLAMAARPDSTIVAIVGGSVDPDGSDFSGSDGSIDLIDVSESPLSPRRITLGDDTSPVSAAIFDGDRLLVGTWNGTVAAIDTADLDDLRVSASVGLDDLPATDGCPVPPDDRKVRSLAIDGDGRWLAAGTNDCRVEILDPATLEPRSTLVGHADKVRALAFVPDSSELLSTGDDRSIRSWDLADDEAAGTVLISAADGLDSPNGALEGRVVTMCVSPDGAHVVTAGRDHEVRRWLRDDNGLRLDPFEYATHSTTVRQVICPTARQFVSTAGDGLVVWNLDRTNRWGSTLGDGTGGRVESVAVRPDGSGEVAVVREGVLRVHRADGISEPASPGPNDLAAFVTYSDDGRRLATIDRNDEGRADEIVIYDAESFEILSTTPAEGVGDLTALDIVDERNFAAGMNEGDLLVVDGGTRTTTSTPHARSVTAVAMSADGRLVVGDIGGTLFCGTASSGLASIELGRAINDVALSEDGTVAAGTADGLIVTYPGALATTDDGGCRPADWTRSAPPVGNDSIASVGLTRDGEVLVAATSSGGVEIWDIPRLRLLGTLSLAADDRAEHVAIDPGAALVVAGGERSVVMFEVDREGLRERLCKIAERNLTPDEEASFLPADGDYREIARCFE
jgi:WD40 repeat protein